MVAKAGNKQDQVLPIPKNAKVSITILLLLQFLLFKQDYSMTKTRYRIHYKRAFKQKRLVISLEVFCYFLNLRSFYYHTIGIASISRESAKSKG
jgi:hypothetical protein